MPQVQLANIAVRQLLDREGFEEDETIAERIAANKGGKKKKKKKVMRNVTNILLLAWFIHVDVFF